MKYIIAIACTFFSISLFAQGKFDVQGDLAPTGAYGIVKARNLKGGYLGSVHDTVARNLIPITYRDSNTLVFTRVDSTMWILKGGLTNDYWSVLSTGGSTDSLNKFKYFVSYLTDTSFTICSKDYSRCDTVAISGTVGVGGTGTVTSIGTNNGTGLTGGTITSSGTLAIDTTLISTNANVVGILENGYLPLSGGTISGNLRVNNTLTSVFSFISQGEIQAQSAIRHTTLKILNKDSSAYTTWLDRKPYYSDGVNLSNIGTASVDTITVAKSAVYATNVAGSYTNRSLIDKGHLDSNLALKRPLNYQTRIVGDKDATIIATDDVVFFNSATAIRDIVIPDPRLYTGKQLIFYCSDTAHKRTFTVTGGSDVINAKATVITFMQYYETYTLVSNGSNWVVINFNTAL